MLTVNVAAAEECLVQSLPVLLFELRFFLANVVPIFEDLAIAEAAAYVRGRCFKASGQQVMPLWHDAPLKLVRN